MLGITILMKQLVLIFKFVEISLISNPVFNSFNGENIKVGQDVRIKAKVEGYNEKQELVFLSPIEVSPR